MVQPISSMNDSSVETETIRLVFHDNDSGSIYELYRSSPVLRVKGYKRNEIKEMGYIDTYVYVEDWTLAKKDASILKKKFQQFDQSKRFMTTPIERMKVLLHWD